MVPSHRVIAIEMYRFDTKRVSKSGSQRGFQRPKLFRHDTWPRRAFQTFCLRVHRVSWRLVANIQPCSLERPQLKRFHFRCIEIWRQAMPSASPVVFHVRKFGWQECPNPIDHLDIDGHQKPWCLRQKRQIETWHFCAVFTQNVMTFLLPSAAVKLAPESRSGVPCFKMSKRGISFSTKCFPMSHYGSLCNIVVHPMSCGFSVHVSVSCFIPLCAQSRNARP